MPSRQSRSKRQRAAGTYRVKEEDFARSFADMCDYLQGLHGDE